MRLFNIRWATALSAAVFAVNSYAGDDDSKKAIVPMEQPAIPLRWSVSLGATVSSIKSTFNADPGLASSLNTSTGIYNGGADQVYQNGVVGIGGPSFPIPGRTGFTGGVITTPTGFFIAAPPTFATFNGATVTPGSASDTETSVGPYIRLDYDVADFASDTLHLSVFGQYSFTTAFNSGDSPLGINNVATTYQAFGVGTPTADVAYPPTGPVTQTSTPQSAFVASGLNIDMHTFELGVDLSKDLADRVHLVFFTGPTLNLFYTGLSSTLVGLPGTGILPSRSDNSAVRFGWDGQLGLQVDLDAKKRWFIEALGGYHWVTPFTVATPISSAKIQASSWSAELGLGTRF